jgi:hypothetical protein
VVLKQYLTSFERGNTEDRKKNPIQKKGRRLLYYLLPTTLPMLSGSNKTDKTVLYWKRPEIPTLGRDPLWARPRLVAVC